MLFSVMISNLLLILALFKSKTLVNGMERVPDNIRSGHNNIQTLSRTFSFCLTELSYLIRILNSVEEEDLYTIKTIQQILIEKEKKLFGNTIFENDINILYIASKINPVRLKFKF
uniref:Uncharacterized protein n=1 Tax=Meloidogyne enterolobii TaxID=390850 RepID=A0A6V7X6S1_MELEN|nr:unnamed protein product [Meloidogyne enterolobii]